jgi:16S rRNA A1518/A1519 N6-dimethyltransferase RsmA/KsgA/DIM1 with predicted DNA glycosylase/AP lyase activity
MGTSTTSSPGTREAEVPSELAPGLAPTCSPAMEGHQPCGEDISAESLRESGFTASASLGQHFLRSASTAVRLLELAGLKTGATVLDVGAGLGTLSRTVAAAGHPVWAVEKDRRLSGALASRLAPFGDQAHAVMDDVRALDLDLMLPHGSVLVSILPFDWRLASGIVTHVFGSAAKVTRGLAVVPSETLEHAATGGAGTCLRLEEVDGISRSEFWPEPGVPLRVVSIARC